MSSSTSKSTSRLTTSRNTEDPSSVNLRQKPVEGEAATGTTTPSPSAAARSNLGPAKPGKPPLLKTLRGRRYNKWNMRPAYIWGPALLLGVVGCAVYFSVTSSPSRTGTVALEGATYDAVRMEALASDRREAKAAPIVPAVFGFKIVKTYPHDFNAFTEGLVYAGQDAANNDILYESTGLYGKSTVRRVVLQTGTPEWKYVNIKAVFGEGLSFVDGRKKLMQLMWQTRKANIFHSTTLKFLGQVTHGMTDGWGLTAAGGGNLYGSDGTSNLYLLNGKTFRTMRKVGVTDGKQPIAYLNELEAINDKVFANVWQTPCVARIAPATGVVDAWVDFEELLGLARAGNGGADVLNGIAWDPVRSRLLVTGKLWPSIYEVQLVQKTSDNPAQLLQSTRDKCWPKL